MIEDCKGVDKSINEVVLVPELAALLQSFACLVASSGSTDCRTLHVSVGGRFAGAGRIATYRQQKSVLKGCHALRLLLFTMVITEDVVSMSVLCNNIPIRLLLFCLA